MPTPKNREGKSGKKKISFEDAPTVLDLKIDTKLKKIKKRLQDQLQRESKILILIKTKREGSEASPRPPTLEEAESQIWQHMSTKFYFKLSIKISLVIE